MIGGTVVRADGTGIACLVPLADACARRADIVRDYARALGLDTGHSWNVENVARRLAWDAPAAGDFPRPILADGCDVANIRPELAMVTWHHVAGAAILGPLCCGTPAGHADSLGELARILRNEVSA